MISEAPSSARRRSARIWIPLVLIVLAGVVRLGGLDRPDQLTFDEQWYVPDAIGFLDGTTRPPLEWDRMPQARISVETTWDHPPLAKMLIAGGMALAGRDASGWRLASALAGCAAVWLLYLLALELWGSIWWAGLAGLMLALDGSAIVHSRLGMLDTFAATFLLAGFLFLVRLRTRPEANGTGWVSRWFGSGNLLAAGVMFGLAAACKWAPAPAIVLGVALGIAWRRRATPAIPLGSVARALVAVPVLTYLVAYLPFWLEHGPNVLGFLDLQWTMFRYHSHPRAGGAVLGTSAPWSWPSMRSPHVYLWNEDHHIVAVGNLAVWWGFLISLPFLALALVRERDWRDGMILAGYASLFLPWLIPNRPEYSYYLVPALPFMCLAVVSTLRRMPSRARNPVAMGYAVLVALVAVAYLPVWMDLPVSQGWLDGLQWVPTWNWSWG